MKLLKLSFRDPSKVVYTKVDDDIYEQIKDLKWNAQGKDGYVTYSFYNKGYPKILLLHRLIMNCPKGMVVDHINRDKLDNRVENLRICTQAQNSYNHARQSKNRYKGVVKKGARWNAQIHYDNTTNYIGAYVTEEEAALAYNAEAIKRGEFAKLNDVIMTSKKQKDLSRQV